MNKTQKRIRQYILEQSSIRMKRLVRIREETKNFPIPELPGDSYQVRWNESHISLDVGFNPINLRKIWEIFKTAGWRTTSDVENLISEFKSDEDTYQLIMWEYYDQEKDKNYWLYIWVTLYSAGAVCKRVKIGEKTITKPIYEVVCKEGAKEGVFNG